MLPKTYLITILISTLISFYYFRQLPAYLKSFCFLLGTTLIIECTAYFFVKKNAWMFNIFTVLEFIFYLSVYGYILNSRKQKNWLNTFRILLLLTGIINMSFFQGLFVFNNYTYALGAIFICISVVMFYLQLLNASNPEPLIRVPMFWISTGLLLFYACNFIFMGLLNYIIGISMPLAKQLHTIIYILNIVMYPLFTIGIACSSKQTKTNSLPN